MGVVVWGSGCFVHKFHWGTLWILSNNPGEIHLQFHLTLKFPPQSSALQLPGLSLHLYSLHIFCKDMQRIFTTTTTTNISICEYLCLVHLERSSILPNSLPPERVSVSEPETHRNAASEQNWNINTTIPHHHPTCLSLHPLHPLHRDLCCLERCEWRSSCRWLRAKRTASPSQQFKYGLCYLCLSYVYSCVDKQQQRDKCVQVGKFACRCI